MNVIVTSHRRSGTHLTIDSILNNFPAFEDSEVLELGWMAENSKPHLEPERVKEVLSQGNTVMKTHLLPDLENRTLPEEARELIRGLFADTKLIYVVRHGLDVMVSLYNYAIRYDPAVREMAIDDFMRTRHLYDRTPEPMNRLEFWPYHYRAWTDSVYRDHLLVVRFEDWLTDYKGTLSRVAAFLDLPLRPEIHDIRLNKSFEHSKFRILRQRLRALAGRITGKHGDRYTSVLPSTGKIGSWQEVFDAAFVAQLPAGWKEMFDRYGYSVDSADTPSAGSS